MDRPVLRGLQELTVEDVPRILLEPILAQAVELRTANPGESLARRSPDEDVGPLPEVDGLSILPDDLLHDSFLVRHGSSDHL